MSSCRDEAQRHNGALQPSSVSLTQSNVEVEMSRGIHILLLWSEKQRGCQQQLHIQFLVGV